MSTNGGSHGNTRPSPQGGAALPQLTVEYDDLEALQTDVAANLSCGRAFVAGAVGVDERSRCELTLVHPVTGNTLCLVAEAVWIATEGPGRGVGLQILCFDSEKADLLATFVRDEKPATSAAGDAPQKQSILDQVRHYSGAKQLKAAREGALSERVALERVYGKALWEVLIQNPRITVPEVARIARKGNAPKPLIETITANPAWLASAEVRRALLSNPRLQGSALDKVLRGLTRAELGRAASQSVYSVQVREAAKKLQQRSGGR